MTEPILATNVKVTVKLHSALTFRNEILGKDKSILIKELGNVKKNDSFYFEFTLKEF